MKTQYLLPTLAFILAFSCNSKEESNIEIPLSEQNLEFEIYDSLVVDYLGNLYLADVSQDGETFLLGNDITDSIYLANSNGEIVSKFKRSGEGPGDYRLSRVNPPQFLNDSEIIIAAWKGFYCYSFSGEFTRSFELEYNPTSSLIDRYNNKMVIMGNQIFYPWEGRNADSIGIQGKSFQLQTRRVEVLELATNTFISQIPFPEKSKFKTDQKAYWNLYYNTKLASMGDSLYVTFRNEPKIFVYHQNQLSTPFTVLNIPFKEFIEKSPKDTDEMGVLDMKEMYGGSINLILPIGNQDFLINYSRGLSNDEFDQLSSASGGVNEKFYQDVRKVNTFGWILFDGKTISNLIEKKPEIGNLGKFISKEEIWFTPNYSEVEKDYVVLYKTRLVSK
jgi:hypothetical protein